MFAALLVIVIIVVLLIVCTAGFWGCGAGHDNTRNYRRNTSKCCVAPCPVLNPGFGHVIRVDQVFGNDATGAISGPPFKTIGAALAAAGLVDQSSTPCFTVWIFPGQYFESELVIPPGVSVLGLDASDGQPPVTANLQSSILNALNGEVGLPTALVSLDGNLAANGVVIRHTQNTPSPSTLVYMGKNSVLKNVVLWVDGSPSSANLTAVSIGTDAAGLCSVNDCVLLVDGRLQPNSPSTNLTCVAVDSANTVQSVNPTMNGCTAAIFSNGLGNTRARAVLDTAPGFLVLNLCTLFALGFGVSHSNEIAVETNNPSTELFLQNCTAGATWAEISQTQGTIVLNGTNLYGFGSNGITNGLSFTTQIYSQQQVFSFNNTNDSKSISFVTLAPLALSYLPVGIQMNFGATAAQHPMVFVIDRDVVLAFRMAMVVKTTGQVTDLVAELVTVSPDESNITPVLSTNTLTISGTDNQIIGSPNTAAQLTAGTLVAVLVRNTGSGTAQIYNCAVTILYY